MSVFVTGDIHGDPRRLNTESFYEQKQFSSNQDENIVIILGDFGLIWSRDSENKQEKYYLDWLEQKSFTTVFVDGNHENHVRLATYPVKQWHGGLVHEIRPHVLHLMRGEMFDIEGRNFFAFGGASSHDVSDGILDYEDSDWREQARKLDKQYKFMYRVKGLSWWQEELPTEAEMQHGFDTLEKYGNKVDFIISHSPSTSELYLMGGRWLYEPDVLTNYLDEVKARASFDYKKHLFGHMHVNKAINTQNICIYEQIIQIL